MFLFKASTMLDLIETHAPDILEGCRNSLAEVREDPGFSVLNGAYSGVPAISLDYAVAEKADNLTCVPLTTSWRRASWSSVWDFMDKDPSGNVLGGTGDIVVDARDNYAFGDHGCVALVGVENGGGDAGRCPRCLQGRGRAHQAGGRAAESQRLRPGNPAQSSAPAVGLVSKSQSRRPVSGQMHHG